MSQSKYDHQAIEKKWQRIWLEKKTFKAEIDPSKPKYYILDMFPYPSGAGLHVGHVTGYTGTDILARYKRQKGFNVLHPMGWDSFGLPAEQYAIRTGTHPSATTEENINTYRRQLQAMGFSYDWDREIATSKPDYYKWTQWIFTKLYEKGLAYEAEMNVNFCPKLGTVLANEEVEEGLSKEGGYPVVRRPLKQWILKITEYADRLIEDLDDLDWPEHLKLLQKNWIGKSLGAEVVFKEQITNEKIVVFTTRADTLFGSTFIVLAPEHPLVDKITVKEKKEQIEDYRKQAASKSDLERTELEKEKTGVWTGSYAEHPITGEEIPIWISDFVLMNYASGAVMSVPAHDERDFEFAKKYKLPIRCVYDPDTKQLKKQLTEGQSLQQAREDILLGNLVWMGDGKIISSKKGDLDLDGLDMQSAKETITQWLERHNKGKSAISYKLRDWLFSRQRYWGEPIPILHFEDGTKRCLTLDELPLIPPELKDYNPKETGESPLSKVDDWMNITDPKTGKKAVRETNTMPQWAGSCWYYLRFCDPSNSESAWSKESEDYWMPVDLYVGGAEHAVLHLLYVRFWHKVLYDCGLVHTKEPFPVFQNQGLVHARSYRIPQGNYVPEEETEQKDGKYIHSKTNQPLLSQIEKMSKSKLNGITPDEIVEEYGADSLRLYEMFMGPFDKEKLWNTDAVTGCKRFLNRFWDMALSDKVTEEENEQALRLGHRLVSLVTQDIEDMQFNTAIAHLMEFINAITKLNSYPKSVVKMATQMLYPFAPHIASEIWERLAETEELAFAPIAKIDPQYLTDDDVIYVIQVNGKMRGRISMKKDQTKEAILELAKKDTRVSKHLEGEILKTIFVPNKLLNFVIKK